MLAQHVEFRKPGGAQLQLAEHFVQLVEQFLVQEFLAAQCTLARTKYLILELLEFRRDVALGPFQRLPARVVDRRLVRLPLADLDVIAVDPVVAEFQRRDAGAFLFAGFQPGDPVLAMIRPSEIV